MPVADCPASVGRTQRASASGRAARLQTVRPRHNPALRVKNDQQLCAPVLLLVRKEEVADRGQIGGKQCLQFRERRHQARRQAQGFQALVMRAQDPFPPLVEIAGDAFVHIAPGHVVHVDQRRHDERYQ